MAKVSNKKSDLEKVCGEPSKIMAVSSAYWDFSLSMSRTLQPRIDHFTVVCLVARPPNEGEATKHATVK